MNQILVNELFDAFANASDKIYIYVSDMKTKMSRWSKSSVDYFGLPDEYIYNAGEVWAEYVHPDDRHMYVEDITAVLSGKSKQHNCQYRARNRYGEYTWVECKGSIICDKDGNPSVFAGLMTRLDNYNKYDPITHLLTGYELMRNDFSGDGALMVLGIDNFRKINSQYGLSYGNEVLIYLAELLLEKTSDDIVYRFQGDEFVVYSPKSDIANLERIFGEVKACTTAEKDSNIVNFHITAGIIEFYKDENITEIIARAERCYNYAKEHHTNNALVYSDEIASKINRRKLVSEELLKSIKNDFKGFRLVYQPILANTGDTVVACEALLRYKSDDEKIGNCYPDEFISILESNGGMKPVGYFVMREAIRQASIWQKKYKDFNVSFNVSYVQLEDPEFVPEIIKAIEKYGANPSKIVVELTESILNVDTVRIKKSFELLRENNILIALDDFGTGNSSFWMLHNIDVDIVKLDQSFIRGLDKSEKGTIDYAIVESVGLMCDRIGCKTVAEGIETDDIWKMISKFEFTGLQGYLFSKPIEVDDFENLLDKYNMVK